MILSVNDVRCSLDNKHDVLITIFPTTVHEPENNMVP